MATPTSGSSEFKIIIENLKELLKQRSLTYKNLAQGLGMSESGVKKIFNGNDVSMQRLIQICQFVGVSISDLLRESETLDVEFTQKQQEEFLKNPVSFFIFWMLVYERRSMQQVQIDLKLTKVEFFRFLRRLDVLQLVDLLPGERLKIPDVRAIRWKVQGEFIRKIYRDWSLNLVKSVAKDSLQADEVFIIRYFQMTPSTHSEFKEALASLEEEFLRRSIFEMKTRPQKLKHVRWVVASDTKSFVTDAQEL